MCFRKHKLGYFALTGAFKNAENNEIRKCLDRLPLGRRFEVKVFEDQIWKFSFFVFVKISKPRGSRSGSFSKPMKIWSFWDKLARQARWGLDVGGVINFTVCWNQLTVTRFYPLLFIQLFLSVVFFIQLFLSTYFFIQHHYFLSDRFNPSPCFFILVFLSLFLSKFQFYPCFFICVLIQISILSLFFYLLFLSKFQFYPKLFIHVFYPLHSFFICFVFIQLVFILSFLSVFIFIRVVHFYPNC